MFASRILLLIPHPDDEIVGFSAAVGRAKKQGAEVFGLYLTHGCLAQDTLWPWQRYRYDSFVARRRAEAEQVAQRLGLTTLGWPSRPARHLWRDLPAVETAILDAIDSCAINQLWLPAYEGGNADHDALNAVGGKVGRDRKIPVLEFAEYNFKDDKAQAQTFPAPNGTETVLRLTHEEQAEKRALLELYVSEQKNLNYVGTIQEVYRPLALYDYALPPHEGALWYTRFQWVPFRHPRVDFTRPEEVAAVWKEYLGRVGCVPAVLPGQNNSAF